MSSIDVNANPLALGPITTNRDGSPDVFKSTEEMQAVISSPRYRDDLEYQHAMGEKIARTAALRHEQAQQEQQSRPLVDTEATYAGQRIELQNQYQATQLIRDERYRKDPAFREAVQAALVRLAQSRGE